MSSHVASLDSVLLMSGLLAALGSAIDLDDDKASLLVLKTMQHLASREEWAPYLVAFAEAPGTIARLTAYAVAHPNMAHYYISACFSVRFRECEPRRVFGCLFVCFFFVGGGEA